eukprot:TRINITY_DN48417_c0_g1_i1.p1 TRINITY_DN48417_c0_g1~~TRINITY_DN48417_c0_g1_i1.p1  ORF type:complete len:431 (-),score=46.34 TRINITY_DN48417_c0_g1_i1:26-1318(-)
MEPADCRMMTHHRASRSSSASSSTSSYRPPLDRSASPGGDTEGCRAQQNDTSAFSTMMPEQDSDKLSRSRHLSSEARSSASSAEATRINSAPDLYAVLNASQSSSEMHLRQCFLQAAVLVHPRRIGSAALNSKRGDGDEEEAFCKVASAWKELGDLGSRFRYDAQLTAEGGLTHKPPSMSLENALSTFAFETWVMQRSTSPLPDDISRVLSVARRLVKQHATPDPEREAGSSPASVERSPSPQRPFAEQCAGPDCTRGGVKQTVCKIGSQCTGDPFSTILGNMSTSCLPRCRTNRACPIRNSVQHDDSGDDSGDDSSDIKDSDDDDDEEVPSSLHDTRLIEPGDIVRTIGLQATAMNGRLGEVVKPLPGLDNRFQVRLHPAAVRHGASTPRSSAKLISIKKQNLRLVRSKGPTMTHSSSSSVPVSVGQFL